MANKLVNCEKTRALCPSATISPSCSSSVSSFALPASSFFLSSSRDDRPLGASAEQGFEHVDLRFVQARLVDAIK